MHQNKNHNQHLPVLLDAVLKYLDPQRGDSYLDLTAGYGGHAAKVLERTKSYRTSLLVDRDDNAVNELKARFAALKASIRWQDFLSASRELADEGRQFDLILADLGVSSPHLNVSSRGFSIQGNGPLDMRMDRRQELTAAAIVNEYSVDQLTEILKKYGEEPKARLIARLITEARPIGSTGELAEVVKRAWPGYSRVHPATRTFQALRIAVNDELRMLESALPIWIELLKPGGRLAVISFHSLEDRLVKQAFKEAGGNRYDAQIRILTKDPITAEPNELVYNPRARSAKLRAAVKK